MYVRVCVFECVDGSATNGCSCEDEGASASIEKNARLPAGAPRPE